MWKNAYVVKDDIEYGMQKCNSSLGICFFILREYVYLYDVN